MKHSLLAQKSDEYTSDVWSELSDLYEGGYTIKRKAGKYLPSLARENSARYKDRLAAAAYIGYLGQIVDYFASALFGQSLTVVDGADANDPATAGGVADKKFWPAFGNDADLQGNSFQEIERRIFVNGILKRRSILACDFPVPDDIAQITSRIDEDKIGANRGYVYEQPLDQVINWKTGKFGAFQWAVIYRCYVPDDSPFAGRSIVRHEWKVWEMSAGVAIWTLYTKDKQASEGFSPDEDVPKSDEGVTTFRQIPLVQFEVPSGLWVGNKIGTLALEHYQRRSQLVNAENGSMIAIPVVKRGPEMSGMGQALVSDTQQNPNRGDNPVAQANAKGWVPIGSGDDIYFAEPEGKAYALVNDQLKELKDEMFRVVHQMAASVDNSAGTMRRSGDSKKMDRQAESIVLGALGKKVREHAKRVYDVISQARGESVVWTPRGLDRFETDDRFDLVQEAIQMAPVDIPSVTLAGEYQTQLWLKIVSNLPPETQDVIRDEIKARAVTKNAIAEAQAKQQQLMASAPPAPPVQPGAPPGPGPTQKKSSPASAAA